MEKTLAIIPKARSKLRLGRMLKRAKIDDIPIIFINERAKRIHEEIKRKENYEQFKKEALQEEKIRKIINAILPPVLFLAIISLLLFIPSLREFLIKIGREFFQIIINPTWLFLKPILALILYYILLPISLLVFITLKIFKGEKRKNEH